MTLITLPIFSVEPTLNLRFSYLTILLILVSLLSSVLTMSFLSKKKLISSSIKISGSYPGYPNTFPTNLSFLVTDGSTYRPTPISPPGTAYNKLLFSASKVMIFDFMGVHNQSPFSFLFTWPGLISISSWSFKIPFKILPPTTPPFKFSISSPGLFTSKDLFIFL